MYSQVAVAPLITASFQTLETAMHNPPTFINPAGAFYVGQTTDKDRMFTTEGTQWQKEILYFNSSRSSSIYKSGGLLRPLSRRCCFMIKY